MIQCSPEFLAAQSADVAAPAFQVNLVLSDYAAAAQGATATSSGDDASGNFPAGGTVMGPPPPPAAPTPQVPQ